MIEAIAQSLQGRKQSDGSFMVLCPAHADQNPSLHISDVGGKILVHCKAGCSQSSIIVALRSKGLWPESKSGNSNRPAGIPSKWGRDADSKSYVIHWTYHDKTGNIIGYIARYEKDGQKDIVPFFKRSGEIWKPGAAPVPRPLYNLQLLKKFPGLSILISEGEKATDAASNFLNDSYICVSWPGGSNAVTKTDWMPLKGREVVIWPDADEPGQKAAILVQEQCIKAGVKSVKIVIPPKGVKAGWDLADADEWTAGNVLEYIEKAKQIKNNLPQGFTAKELLNTTFPDPRWAVNEILPEGLNILGGKPKAGKSIMALNLAIAIALGGKALQAIDVEKGSVIYLALEDTGRRLQKRIKQMLQYCDEAPANLHLFTTWPRMGQGGMKELDTLIKNTPDTRLVIIDTLAKIRPPGKANGNLYSEDYETISCIKKFADDNQVCVLLIHHLRKMESSDVFDMFSGTFGLSGAADGLMVMGRNKTGQMVFSLTGRDVEQQSYVLEFDPKMLSWKLIGKAEEIKSTDERQILFDSLKKSTRAMSPQDIEKATGLKNHYIRKTLPILLQEGTIKRIGRGLYIYHGNNGNNGNIKDNGNIGNNPEIDQLFPDNTAGNNAGNNCKPLNNKGLEGNVPIVPIVPIPCNDCKYTDKPGKLCCYLAMTGKPGKMIPVDQALKNCPLKKEEFKK